MTASLDSNESDYKGRKRNMMLDRAHALLKDDRRDLRIREDEYLAWQIKYKQREGKARIHNISASGMLMETDAAFDPSEECILSFDSYLGEDNYIPQVGRLVWHKKKRFSRKKYLCGIKFLEADEQVLGRMHRRVRAGVTRFLKRRQITTNIGLLLCAICIALLGFVLWFSGTIYRDVTVANQRMLEVSEQQTVLTQNYVQRYQAREVKLAETTEALNNTRERLRIGNQIIKEEAAALTLFSKELEATKALLGQTETMLTQANERNAELNNQNLALSNEIPALQTAQVQAQIVEEEKSVTVDDAAQTDDQKLSPGNGGYFVKEGQPIEVDEAQHQRLETDKLQDSVASQVEREVEIDVTFFE